MTEQEELQMLRVLVAKQKEQLEAKNRIIEERDAKINRQKLH